MPDMQNIAQTMTKIIDELGVRRKQIEQLGVDRAKTEAKYDKHTTITMAELEHGATCMISETDITSKTATGLKEKAKGICWEYKQEMMIAESAYKACITNIDCLKAQLNAMQSLYKGQIET